MNILIILLIIPLGLTLLAKISVARCNKNISRLESVKSELCFIELFHQKLMYIAKANAKLAEEQLQTLSNPEEEMEDDLVKDVIFLGKLLELFELFKLKVHFAHGGKPSFKAGEVMSMFKEDFEFSEEVLTRSANRIKFNEAEFLKDNEFYKEYKDDLKGVVNV